ECDRMLGHDIRAVRQHQADGERPAGLGDDRHGVAHHLGPGGDDDIGPAVEDDPEAARAAADDAPLPDQAAGGPSPAGEDPQFLGPD
ncbi:MAG TPA: hypothetical protein VFG13_11935, partial [Blastococcus sp.]|nr:hypothetical protein [Blastococcus sp.]